MLDQAEGRMICVIPFCNKDAAAALRLLSWIGQLGTVETHVCLLVADCSVNWGVALDALTLANKAFRTATIITNEKPVDGWIPGANSLFFTAAEHIERENLGRWLWLEPDCVPLKRDWLNKIYARNVMEPKPFMGQIYRCEQPDLPKDNLSGIAVYPHDAFSRLKQWRDSTLAFDVACAYVTVPDAAHTELIQHYWGEGMPPLNPGAVVFHREKTGVLIASLQRQMGFESSRKITVVFPVAPFDVHLALRHSAWLNHLGPWDHDAVVSCDPSINGSLVSLLVSNLEKCFNRVLKVVYPTPPVPGWPHAPNWAFQHTARHMMKLGVPWLWLEADAVVMHQEWLAALQDEYDRCGKAFMGPVVEAMGHINGVSVYPANTPQLIPRAMTCTDRAWDYEMKLEMIHNCHDAGHLIFHAWLVNNGRIHPNSGTHVPDFADDNLFRQIPKSAVIVHRSKDGHLLDRLMR